jgi:hypothetical protein
VATRKERAHLAKKRAEAEAKAKKEARDRRQGQAEPKIKRAK